MTTAAQCDLSILIPVNSRPRHLSLVLAGIAQLQPPTTTFRGEVRIRHTGTDAEIGAVARAWQAQPVFAGGPWRLVYDHQPVDSGNRSENRNAAIAQATGERLVFLDADCIPARDFLVGHWRLLAPGSFVSGDALRLSETFSQQLTDARVAAEDPHQWITAALRQDQTRRRARAARHLRLSDMHKIPLQGGNFSCWRADMVAINGFDRHYAGWGQEDTDIGARLFLLGRLPVNGVAQATALHIWHPPLDRPAQWKEGGNVGYFLRPGRMVRCRQGLVDRPPADIAVAVEARGTAAQHQAAVVQLVRAAGYCPAADPRLADWILQLADQPTAPQTTPTQIGIGLSAAQPGFLQRLLKRQRGLQGASWWLLAATDPLVLQATLSPKIHSQVNATPHPIGSAGWLQVLQNWLPQIG